MLHRSQSPMAMRVACSQRGLPTHTPSLSLSVLIAFVVMRASSVAADKGDTGISSRNDVVYSDHTVKTSAKTSDGVDVTVVVQDPAASPVYVVADEYVSFAMDMSFVFGGTDAPVQEMYVDWNNTRLRNAVKMVRVSDVYVQCVQNNTQCL